MNCKRKSRRRFFLLVRSRIPPISSEFRRGVWKPQTPPPLGTPLNRPKPHSLHPRQLTGPVNSAPLSSAVALSTQHVSLSLSSSCSCCKIGPDSYVGRTAFSNTSTGTDHCDSVGYPPWQISLVGIRMRNPASDVSCVILCSCKQGKKIHSI